MIERILKYFPQDSYAVFSGNLKNCHQNIDHKFRITGKYMHTRIAAVHSGITSFRRNIGQWLEIPVLYWDLRRAVRKNSVGHLLVSYTPNEINLVITA